MIIDQRKLPHQFIIEPLCTVDDAIAAIRDMHVRGAGLIGATAGFGMHLAAAQARPGQLADALADGGDRLDKSRPTARNLFYATTMVYEAGNISAENALTQALWIADKDTADSTAIGEYGNELIKPGFRIQTHCNAGWLAFVNFGTALSPIYKSHQSGKEIFVWVDETRPRSQGARLTAFELLSAGIDVTLICDNMAGVVMSKGKVDAVITGCDRVASNGDTANKIGTMSLSILAKYFRIPFYIAAPTPTIDMSASSGEDIPIEERAPEEMTTFRGLRVAPEGIKTFNPAFDVTPAENITAIVTEKKIVYPPFEKNLKTLFERS